MFILKKSINKLTLKIYSGAFNKQYAAHGVNVQEKNEKNQG